MHNEWDYVCSGSYEVAFIRRSDGYLSPQFPSSRTVTEGLDDWGGLKCQETLCGCGRDGTVMPVMCKVNLGIHLLMQQFTLLILLRIFKTRLRATLLSVHFEENHKATPAISTSSQSARNICITFVQCWTNVEDVGPALHKCYTNVLCLLDWFQGLPC